MSKDLIIVESPAKVKTISKFLGRDYLVEASVGHVRDLPGNKLGVDEDNDFRPQYQVLSGKQKVVSKLRKAANQAEQVFLAPDPDREGEAIAWHVAELIKSANSNIHRIQFNEITAGAVRDALKHPRQLDDRLFQSQQARRILDRLVGYKISPLLWQKVKRGISAGRVQSVALRLIVEREKERQAFVPEEYWVFKASLRAETLPEFEAELWKINGAKAKVGTQEQAEDLAAKVSAASFQVQEIKEKERSKQPKPPFITSSLQQEASNRHNFSAKQTMALAQQLYEGVDLGSRGTTALITYMRTDSVRISKEARDGAKEWILSNMGQDYYPPKPRTFKSKGSAQDAHEAIRPVDVSIHPDQVRSYLTRQQYQLYKLIWLRFMASQMAAAKFWDTTVTVRAENTLWRAKGERLTFPGFMSLYVPEDQKKEVQLPPMTEGEELSLQKLSKEQKFTQPPNRFTEASLVRKLEDEGIGRPSTYAQIISTLRDRDYVRMEGRQFLPTELGYTVNDLLVAHFSQLMDVGFTAQMENQLDQVATGEQDWLALLRRFTQDFNPTLDKAKQEMSEVKSGIPTEVTCEKCGRPMVIKFGKNGEFLACSGYPECTNTSNFARDEQGAIQLVAPPPQEQTKVGTCPKCGSDLVLKKARTGSRFIACSSYPKCKYAQPFGTGVPCPQEDCPGELVEKSSKRGKVFYACDQYPKCSYAVWDYPVQEPCPKCESPILVRKTTKARGEHLACPNRSCSYWRKLEDDAEGQASEDGEADSGDGEGKKAAGRTS
ncbi:type I DNA topoisomerase [Desulfovermiculus halophilus]|jgi:DNA topoisomerase-1|uniref:type I DNA topoisomerase n=1 Tax=Desulfovermiculus halophilus TaxID=339722 RepID=UPI0006843375|nr:type I DNA topoisomerase [Desulfovermiculus halophilus]